MRRLLLVLVLLATGCSLPLPHDVQKVGEVPGERLGGGPLQVIPPGPRRGATATDVVLGFLGAQASSDAHHAIAREFLTARERSTWRDEAEVQVYDPDTLRLQQPRADAEGRTVVRVVSKVSGQVRADGSFVVRPAVTVTEDYRLLKVQGEWRLDEVPEGLRLTAADRQRAYAPRPVYYLAPVVGDAPARLVPDQVFLPVGQDLARTLLTRLLRPPSQALAGSVTTAVPEGTRLGGVESSSGLVTVDLVGGVARPTGQAAQDLSAQVVWTLGSLGTSFRGLRLRLDGRPLEVPGEDDVQDPTDWGSYDPQGLGPNPPYFFSSARRLRASVDLPPSPATTGTPGDGRAVPVDAVAVTPDQTRVALVEGTGSGPSVVRIGPLRGSSFPVAARGQALTSPSWGSGAQGLWLLRGGRDVVRVASGLHEVTVLGLPSGRLTSLAVSRDGVRVALVVAGRLYVGRVELVAGGPRIVDLVLVLPGLQGVSRVAWSSSTELAVLVAAASKQVLRVSVDGSSVLTLNTAGLLPTGLAASPVGVVLLVGGRLYLASGGSFRQVQPEGASAPAFPG